MIRSHDEPFPEIPEIEARSLAALLAAFPAPEQVDDQPPSEEFLDGFNEFRTIAVAMVLKAGGVTEE